MQYAQIRLIRLNVLVMMDFLVMVQYVKTRTNAAPAVIFYDTFFMSHQVEDMSTSILYQF